MHLFDSFLCVHLAYESDELYMIHGGATHMRDPPERLRMKKMTARRARRR